jgi:hypothetical protein
MKMMDQSRLAQGPHGIKEHVSKIIMTPTVLILRPHHQKSKPGQDNGMSQMGFAFCP